MRCLVTRWALVVVMVLQTVSAGAFAFAPASEVGQSTATTAGDPPAPPQTAPCHEAESAATTSGDGCCDTMDNAACLLSCSLAGAAIAGEFVRVSIRHPATARTLFADRYQSLSPPKIFHPPRTD